MTSYTVNASILLTDRPLLERPAAVAAAGFDAVEFWWPFSTPVPGDAEIDAFVRSVTEAGIQLTGLNFFAGDMPAGDRGVLSSKSRAGEFHDNIDVVVGIGQQLGCRAFNALYGLRSDDVSAAESDEIACDSLIRAATAVAAIDGIVLLEPVSGAPGYPLLTVAHAHDVLATITSVDPGVTNVRLLADFYHLAVNGDDVDAVIAAYAADFGHVQIADAPGRGAPGTGDLPLQRWIAESEAGGYSGLVGLEYKFDADDPFAWLPRADRGTR